VSQRPAFERIAIVNRGEPAMRLINAVREWNTEGRPPLRAIAVHTAADRRATSVREADEAVLLDAAWPAVYAEKLGQLADEFDNLHSIERARDVGSVNTIVPASRLRPYLIEAVQRGMHRTLATLRERQGGNSPGR
jgi:biotin carboxylase